MDELIANLVEAYRRNISDLDWMTPATREKALTKLGKFTPKSAIRRIGGTIRRWSSTAVIWWQLRAGDVVRAGSRVRQDRRTRRPRRMVHDPQTVNAYYNPGMNEIVFPAAILQPPFFDPDADDAANYGGIGAVIGHEIGHGFDDQGAKYDGDGNLVDWWSEADRTEFGKRTKKLIDQYSEFTPTGLDPEHTVNGEFTIGENIGDLGGLSIALVAHDVATEGNTPPVIDGLTGVQRCSSAGRRSGVPKLVTPKRSGACPSTRTPAGVPLQRRRPQRRRLLRRVRHHRDNDCTSTKPNAYVSGES